MNNTETFIWTPLIGFDKEQQDRGVNAYYSTIGFKPDGISLFVFCPDIVHQHDGMDVEKVLSPDNCNYYGNIRNEIRDIQPWTNWDLRELVSGIESQGTRSYMGLMGVFSDREESDPEPYNIGHREWLFDHRELAGVWTDANYSLNVLKRFKDGTYYEDFFLQKVRQALADYGFSGLHAADCFCPHSIATFGDFSDDMMDQFVAHSGVKLPAEIGNAIDRFDREGIKNRGSYIWNRHKIDWVRFLSWRWGTFWKKICAGLHEDGKTVMVNNAWCCDPFEAIYRYGIDYQKLHNAGVDYLVAESVPTGVNSMAIEGVEHYRFYDFTTMPSFMKAYTPSQKVLCLNGVKDSTEEWSNITFYPSHLEREIYALSNYFLHTSQGLVRAMDGSLICLGDGLTQEEWSWLTTRWDAGVGDIPREVLTPMVIWSDHMAGNFLEEYVATRRWSAHKTIYELAKSGGQMGAIARVDDLSTVHGPIFIPNVDQLPESELNMIAAYDKGAILCTSLVERNFEMPNSMKPDIYFEDPNVELKMCFFAYHAGEIDVEDITALLGEDDGSDDIDLQHIHNPEYLGEEIAYRKVSLGFKKACSKLIRACYPCALTTKLGNQILPLQMDEGKVRLLLGNDRRLQYQMPEVKSECVLKNVASKSTFPALPAKLLDAEGKVVIPKSDGSHGQIPAYGFVAKIPPGGMTIIDVELED